MQLKGTESVIGKLTCAQYVEEYILKYLQVCLQLCLFRSKSSIRGKARELARSWCILIILDWRLVTDSCPLCKFFNFFMEVNHRLFQIIDLLLLSLNEFLVVFCVGPGYFFLIC